MPTPVEEYRLEGKQDQPRWEGSSQARRDMDPQPLVIPWHLRSLLSSLSFITCASLGILEIYDEPPPGSVVVLGLYMARFSLKDFLDFHGRYLYPYAILAHSTASMHLPSMKFNTANHIYPYRPRVLPHDIGADPRIRTSSSDH